MKWHRTSERPIQIESYVTPRSEWTEELRRWVDVSYMARGHRVVDGKMEWRYFVDDVEAKKWCDAVHSNPGSSDDTEHRFLVTVSGCSADEAEEVMRERIYFDENYGFDYTIEYRAE